MPVPAGLRHSLFDDWDHLTKADLARWLTTVSGADEGLYWEAKGGDAASAEDVHVAMSAFGNADEGYLILGVGRNARNDPWKFESLTFSDEPLSWISQFAGSAARALGLDRRSNPAPARRRRLLPLHNLVNG